MSTGVDTAVIPLAGLATRMQPLARSIPKEMLPLGDRPVLHSVVEELVDAGIRHVVLVVGSRSEAIERYFHAIPDLDQKLLRQDTEWPVGSVWSRVADCSFSFVRQDRPSGVIDAVRRAHRIVGDRRYLVHMGDSIVWRDSGLLRRIIATHEMTGADATIGVGSRLPDSTSSRAVAEPVEGAVVTTDGYPVRRIVNTSTADDGTAPFVIGRYLFEGPLPAPNGSGAPTGGSGRLGELAALVPNEELATVMAVPLLDTERLMGSGTMAEYLASWQQWLEGSLA